MPRKGRSNEEIVHALHQVEGGEKVTEVCRRLGVSEQTFYRWKKQFAGLGLQEIRELRSLRHENVKLKQLVADLTLDRHILQEIVRNTVKPRARCTLAEWAQTTYCLSQRRASSWRGLAGESITSPLRRRNATAGSYVTRRRTVRSWCACTRRSTSYPLP
ncbi:MAG: transposase [Acidimicrobiia bacterium]|nr:transposase [Acidimicrobiia bacterium]